MKILLHSYKQCSMEQRSSKTNCYNEVLYIKAKVVVRMAELVRSRVDPSTLGPCLP